MSIHSAKISRFEKLTSFSVEDFTPEEITMEENKIIHYQITGRDASWKQNAWYLDSKGTIISGVFEYCHVETLNIQKIIQEERDANNGNFVVSKLVTCQKHIHKNVRHATIEIDDCGDPDNEGYLHEECFFFNPCERSQRLGCDDECELCSYSI